MQCNKWMQQLSNQRLLTALILLLNITEIWMHTLHKMQTVGEGDGYKTAMLQTASLQLCAWYLGKKNIQDL